VLWSRHLAKKLPLPSAAQRTRQRDWQRGPLEDSLPRARPLDTRQRSKPPLPSANESSRHRDWRWGPLEPSLSRAMIADTQQNWPLCRVPKKTLVKGPITVTWHRDGDFSLPSTKWHSANSLPSARQKVLGKEVVADVQFTERSLPSVTLGKVFAECYSGFVECFQHSAKRSTPVVTFLTF
jgi:hypothetical protein